MSSNWKEGEAWQEAQTSTAEESEENPMSASSPPQPLNLTRSRGELAEVKGTSPLLSFKIKDGQREAGNGSMHEQDFSTFVLHCELTGTQGAAPLTPKLRQARII